MRPSGWKKTQTKKNFTGWLNFRTHRESVSTLVMFAYTSLEVIARKRRMEGFNVLFPIGWDAFGLPTENYAIQTGRHPRK